ncbi:SCO2400 family protein [Streptomyces sp. NPDC054849]
MNYCHACRRHLNGALACAGCGTPAEYLIPAASVAAPVPGPAAEVPVAEAPAALADVFADSLVVLSAPSERRAGARRRATHRRRRRTVLTISLGLLIALGGSLAVARMATDGDRTDRAAKVVLTDDGPQQPAPLPDLPTAGAPTGSGKATAKAAPGTKKAGPGAPTGGVAQPGLTPSAPAPATSGPVSGTPGPGKSVQGATGQPSESVSGDAPTSQPPSPTKPAPTPTPTKDCGFLGMLCWGD